MFRKLLVRLLREEEGATAVEYAVMVSALVLVCVAALFVLGVAVQAAFDALGAAVGST
jgi:Flp pilus assembly pilin Flp